MLNLIKFNYNVSKNLINLEKLIIASRNYSYKDIAPVIDELRLNKNYQYSSVFFMLVLGTVLFHLALGMVYIMGLSPSSNIRGIYEWGYVVSQHPILLLFVVLVIGYVNKKRINHMKEVSELIDRMPAYRLSHGVKEEQDFEQSKVRIISEFESIDGDVESINTGTYKNGDISFDYNIVKYKGFKSKKIVDKPVKGYRLAFIARCDLNLPKFYIDSRKGMTLLMFFVLILAPSIYLSVGVSNMFQSIGLDMLGVYLLSVLVSFGLPITAFMYYKNNKFILDKKLFGDDTHTKAEIAKFFKPSVIVEFKNLRKKFDSGVFESNGKDLIFSFYETLPYEGMLSEHEYENNRRNNNLSNPKLLAEELQGELEGNIENENTIYSQIINFFAIAIKTNDDNFKN